MIPQTVGAAYSATGVEWQRGPGAIYERLSDVVVAQCPVALAGRTVLDLGAGTGAASRAIARCGGRPLAVDLALGMLLADRDTRPPAALADALALPLRSGAVGGVVAAFSLNHLTDPVAGLREAARVVASGSPVLASAYAEDDTHPAKAAAESAARRFGWEPPPWYHDVREHRVPRLATVERAQRALEAAGLAGVAIARRVAFPELGARELVAWRLGMAQLAPFVASLDSGDRRRLFDDAVARLGEPDPLVRSIIVLVAIRD